MHCMQHQIIQCKVLKTSNSRGGIFFCFEANDYLTDDRLTQSKQRNKLNQTTHYLLRWCQF